jgi:hypothetical protein
MQKDMMEGVVFTSERAGEEVIKARAGCRVLKPRRVPHNTWNKGPSRRRAWSEDAVCGFIGD